jgi:8-oxo-dGTP pyrophosphatase MutT (NUDIX family)
MPSWIRKQVGQIAVGRLSMAVKGLLWPTVLGANAMVFDREGRVLLARHSYMTGLSFPGGGIKRGEPAVAGLLRELKEEIGIVNSDPPELFGIYTRPTGWATNTIVIYRVTNAEIAFKPNLEVREIVFADPADPPEGTSLGTRRRLAEHLGQTPINPYW